MILVIDTSTLFSAVFFGGPPKAILNFWISGVIRVAVSPVITKEYERVLRQSGISKAHLKNLSLLIEDSGKTILSQPRRILRVVISDPSDDKFFECAVDARADVIVSSDRQVQKVISFENIPVLSPRQFLNLAQDKPI
ncbi:MAG: putative toxin-antitoxin system toxin component, PIN family [Elusimicrobia bacterium]|nr:putative toxin-antitoxin system toxin component, PIN family [Elusimicrobiota bacterium]